MGNPLTSETAPQVLTFQFIEHLDPKLPALFYADKLFEITFSLVPLGAYKESSVKNNILIVWSEGISAHDMNSFLSPHIYSRIVITPMNFSLFGINVIWKPLVF
jgi:hypothetical protein